ncbi:group I intron endonuclease [Nonlabens sp. Hel1_33_55]|uniref:GIY-YIG nuclease family protein n=1 Tax=Nonlabens sp. Hel1_33_55 TaxID=1336802 RepID=UPI000875EC1A|nr:GIY-YIG nuclease family protein [Nonlabens sp. Hel1_33_55]SCY36605.1 group I intron endonuclease [Nonlabens sp. Hel1_33_55]
MKNKNHIIYKVTKVTNRKVYIGATTKSIRERQLDHLERAARGQVGKLYEAIRTLGPEAFKWQTIDTAESINELAKKEKYWIQKYNSKVDGYNSDEGGGFKKTVYQYDIGSRQLINEFPDLTNAAMNCRASKQAISRAALSVNNEYAGYL